MNVPVSLTALPKQTVRGAFSSAVERYDQLASFQRLAAEKLLAGAPEITIHRHLTLLDLGCGTGYGMRLMQQRWPVDQAQCLALDFALPMLSRLPAQTQPVCADAHALPLAPASVDFLFSNLAMQWCEINAFAKEVARVMTPGGHAAISSLAPETFSEMRKAFAGVDGFAHTLAFLTPEAMQQSFLAHGLQVSFVRETLRCHFEDLPSLLASVRELGANRLPAASRRRGLMGKSAWQRFVAAYEAQRDPAGLPLSYDTVFLYISKPADAA